MFENKQNTEEKKISNGSGEKKHQDVLKWVIVGISVFIVIVLIFSAGIMVGGMKARFSYRWAENYHKNFAGPREGFFGNWQGAPSLPGDFIEGHGVFGQIIKINVSTSSGTTLAIKGNDGVEKIVLIKDDTTFEKFRDKVKIADLKVDDYIVVIGEPNDSGQIEAKFIRILPPPNKTSFRELPPHIF